MKLPKDRAAMDEHIRQFEEWFSARQREAGLDGTQLISVEHAILRSYITWLRIQDAQDAHARDQAQ